MPRLPRVLIGLPYSNDGVLAEQARRLDADVLISMGSLYRPGKGFQPIGQAVFRSWGRVCLDSAGFVAMKQGGYRWTVSEYVEYVQQSRGAYGCSVGVPWGWWSSMDYCCEPEIAHDRELVLERVEKTATTLGEVLEEVDYWRHVEGDSDLDDPLPILQGWDAEDYALSLARTIEVLAEHGRELPTLLGVGSVCRRHVKHPTHGLLVILQKLHELLPAHVRLHLFGVKGTVLSALPAPVLARIESIDSMAWDKAATESAKRVNVTRAIELGLTLKQLKPTSDWTPNTVENRAAHMRRWTEQQLVVLQGRSDELAEIEPPTVAWDSLGGACCPKCGRVCQGDFVLDAIFGTRPRRRSSGLVVRVPQSWCRDCRTEQSRARRAS